MSTQQIYDAIVVGAGHNGLTAAAYLGAAGLSTLVLERRGVVGGCCVTEEIAPGSRASITSYIASMLRPEVISDLGLPSHGLQMVPCDPVVQVPFPDGRVISWNLRPEESKQGIAKFSGRPREATALLPIKYPSFHLALTDDLIVCPPVLPNNSS